MNAVAYGVFALGVAIALLTPEQTAARAAAREASGFPDLIRSLLETPLLFAGVILAVNLLSAGLVQMVLPSLAVPFAGVAVLAYRSLTLGLDMVPTDRDGELAMIPHSVTLIVEFQAYVLLALGTFLLGRAWLSPRRVGAVNRRQGYLRGLRDLGRLSVPAVVLLIVGAVYEALTLGYLVPVMIDIWG